MMRAMMLQGYRLARAIAGSAHGAGPLDGKWAGRTSQNNAVAFEIKDGALKSFTLGWKAPLDEPCFFPPGATVATTVLGGRDTIFFPYTRREFEDQRSLGERGIDLTVVAPTVSEKGFEMSRELQGTARLRVVATAGSDDTISGTAQITAIACKGRQTISWTATRRN